MVVFCHENNAEKKLTEVIFDAVLDSMKLEMTGYLHLHINFEFKERKKDTDHEKRKQTFVYIMMEAYRLKMTLAQAPVLTKTDSRSIREKCSK